MDGRILPDMRQRHLHDPPDAVPVDVVHAESLDAVVAQDLLLAAVHVAQANVHELGEADALVGAQPAEDVGARLGGQAGQEGDGHAVHVAGLGCLGRVDVGVRVDPDDGEVAPVVPLADGLRRAADGADRDRVVAAQRQDEASLRGVRVDLRREPLSHGADREGVLHIAVGRVGGGRDVAVAVYGVVMVEVVA